jgi:hypothetical protein
MLVFSVFTVSAEIIRAARKYSKIGAARPADPASKNAQVSPAGEIARFGI